MTSHNDDNAQQLLYLFSSNIRPLYEQDILDLLAAPSGIPYRFRYYKKYVEDETKEIWGDLAGTEILVHFSLQQQAEYHDPVFIPIRMGRVVRAYNVADIFVVEFYPGQYVSLQEPNPERGKQGYSECVKAYSALLHKKKIPVPYPCSAGLGSSILDSPELKHDENEDADVIYFERTTKYLRKTQSFAQARFFRLMYLRELATLESAGNDVKCTGNTFVVRAGHNYELGILHSQPSEVTGRQVFRVATDQAILKVIGKESFDVASRYDVISIPIHATDTDRHETRRTVLIVEPEDGVQGPRMRLPIDVRTPAKRTAKGITGSAATALLLGVPILFPMLPAGAKALFIFAAAVLTGLLSAFGLKRA